MYDKLSNINSNLIWRIFLKLVTILDLLFQSPYIFLLRCDFPSPLRSFFHPSCSLDLSSLLHFYPLCSFFSKIFGPLGPEVQFLCRLPFWQRHLIFPMSSKSWHLLKSLFWCFLISIYFIELKFINVENSLYIYLSLSLSLFLYMSVNIPRLNFLSKFFTYF